MTNIKAIIVDDNSDFREALMFMLESFSEVKVIGQAANGIEFLNMLKYSNPDLIFMDIDMPGLNGIEATKQAIKEYGSLNIIGLTFYNDFKWVQEMIYAGAKNYIIKNELTEDKIKQAIQYVMPKTA